MTTKLWVKRLVEELATSPELINRKAPVVLKAVCEELKRRGQSADNPSLRWVQEIIRHARARVAVDEWLDEPFSIGALVGHRIDHGPDDMNTLLSLLVQADFYLRPFTNRIAIWAIRLRKFPGLFRQHQSPSDGGYYQKVLNTDPENVDNNSASVFGLEAIARGLPWKEDVTYALMQLSCLYADEERASVASGTQFSTVVIDRELAWRLSPWGELLRQATTRNEGRSDNGNVPDSEDELGFRLLQMHRLGVLDSMSMQWGGFHAPDFVAEIREAIIAYPELQKYLPRFPVVDANGQQLEEEEQTWDYMAMIDGSVLTPEVYLALSWLRRIDQTAFKQDFAEILHKLLILNSDYTITVRTLIEEFHIPDSEVVKSLDDRYASMLVRTANTIGSSPRDSSGTHVIVFPWAIADSIKRFGVPYRTEAGEQMP